MSEIGSVWIKDTSPVPFDTLTGDVKTDVLVVIETASDTVRGKICLYVLTPRDFLAQ